MKKSIPTFLTIFLTSLVSAGPVEGVGQLLGGLGEVIVLIIQFISNMILDINSFDEFLFAKLIFLILIFLVIYTVIGKNNFFGKNDSINKIITAAISILAVRFIPDELVRVIFLQYGALGAGLGMAIPFLTILFFLHRSDWGPLPRKIGWITYGLCYIALFAYVYTNLTEIVNYVYWIGIIGIIVAYFFDRQIHAAFGDVAMRKSRRGFEATRYADLQRKVDHISNDLSEGGLPPSVETSLEKRRDHFLSELKKISRSM
jgi:hypothetical protein